MQNKKTNIIIQCRFSSFRLPGKAMYPLCGIPMLTFLIRRLSWGLEHEYFRIIVATSDSPEDNPVEAWAHQEGVACIRGNLENVLARYMKTIRAFPSVLNVRVTADNPLTCPDIINSCVRKMENEILDYIQSYGYPLGAGVDVFTTDLLHRIQDMAKTPEDFEHLNNVVLHRPRMFKTGKLTAPQELLKPQLRMTVDTPEDFERMSAALCTLDICQRPAWEVPLKKAVQLFEQIKRN
ncbi:hypothetical protein HXW94_08300 [Desulfobacter latus]|uniref:Acylneuraminate cytidylyltransferase n=2 Tax=Desulfobacter latus TaxID=2292 RepID=A0A850T6J2_9BACT|nr:hypothetical protein [Desulfobacter latus]NWH04982.1 hypothetical protein [Desulfobacter latus]